jgi:hypothetical protein
MKTLRFLLTILQSIPAYLSRDKQRLSFLLYLPGLDITTSNTAPRHHGRGSKPRAKYVEIDAYILHHEYFVA